jgi:hypothetical protein
MLPSVLAKPRSETSNFKRAYPLNGGVMYHFATTLFAGMIATVLGSGIAFMPIPAEAAKLSKAEKITLEKATVECKEEAKGMKFT